MRLLQARLGLVLVGNGRVVLALGRVELVSRLVLGLDGLLPSRLCLVLVLNRKGGGGWGVSRRMRWTRIEDDAPSRPLQGPSQRREGSSRRVSARKPPSWSGHTMRGKKMGLANACRGRRETSSFGGKLPGQTRARTYLLGDRFLEGLEGRHCECEVVGGFGWKDGRYAGRKGCGCWGDEFNVPALWASRSGPLRHRNS